MFVILRRSTLKNLRVQRPSRRVPRVGPPGTVPVLQQLPRTPRSSSGSNPPGNRGRNPDSKGEGNVLSVPASNGLSDPLC